MRSIGLMSGTSMDGIDAALLETDGSSLIKSLGHASITYSQEFKVLLKAAEYAVRQHQGALELACTHYLQHLTTFLRKKLQIAESQLDKRLKQLAHYLLVKDPEQLSLEKVIQHSTNLHELAIRKLLKKTGYPLKQIDVIAYHGQTLFHQPRQKCSIIVGHGQYLADQLGITVVNDFRRADIDHGGQGAPFAPLYHHALAIRDHALSSAIVNCGGIANITFVQNENILDLLAFDTGPGNGLIDRLVQQRSQGKESMDKNGRYGKKGRVNPETLQALYEKALILNQENYFQLPPPKSLDIGDLKLIPEIHSLSLEDACATLEAFTADSIANSLQWLKTDAPKQWILAGGGWKNPVIYGELKARLEKNLGKTVKVLHAREVGWNSQALEAEIFAYLAVRSLQNQVLSVPGTTGVSAPVSGGKVNIPAGGVSSAVKKLIEAHPAIQDKVSF